MKSIIITRTQARAVAKILSAYAEGKKLQWRPAGIKRGGWRDGDPIGAENVTEWLREHRIKPNQ